MIIKFTKTIKFFSVVIPHLGSANIETRIEMAKLTADNIIAALENKPLPAPL